MRQKIAEFANFKLTLRTVVLEYAFSSCFVQVLARGASFETARTIRLHFLQDRLAAGTGSIWIDTLTPFRFATFILAVFLTVLGGWGDALSVFLNLVAHNSTGRAPS